MKRAASAEECLKEISQFVHARVNWPMPQSIPPGLTKEHVLRALADLDSGIEHPFGQPTGYFLVHEDKELGQFAWESALPILAFSSDGKTIAASARNGDVVLSVAGTPLAMSQHTRFSITDDLPVPGPATRRT